MGDELGRLTQLIGRVCGVAQHEAGWSGALTVPGQRVDEDAGLVDPVGEVRVVDLVGKIGERDEEMKACGDTLDAGSGQVLSQGVQQGIAPVSQALADQANVALELTAGDQVGQDQLRQRRAPQVTGVLGRDQLGMHPPGRDEPAQAHAGGQRLGRAAGVGDPVRGGSL